MREGAIQRMRSFEATTRRTLPLQNLAQEKSGQEESAQDKSEQDKAPAVWQDTLSVGCQDIFSVGCQDVFLNKPVSLNKLRRRRTESPLTCGGRGGDGGQERERRERQRESEAKTHEGLLQGWTPGVHGWDDTSDLPLFGVAAGKGGGVGHDTASDDKASGLGAGALAPSNGLTASNGLAASVTLPGGLEVEDICTAQQVEDMSTAHRQDMSTAHLAALQGISAAHYTHLPVPNAADCDQVDSDALQEEDVEGEKVGVGGDKVALVPEVVPQVVSQVQDKQALVSQVQDMHTFQQAAHQELMEHVGQDMMHMLVGQDTKQQGKLTGSKLKKASNQASNLKHTSVILEHTISANREHWSRRPPAAHAALPGGSEAQGTDDKTVVGMQVVGSPSRHTTAQAGGEKEGMGGRGGGVSSAFLKGAAAPGALSSLSPTISNYLSLSPSISVHLSLSLSISFNLSLSLSIFRYLSPSLSISRCLSRSNTKDLTQSRSTASCLS